MSGIGAAVGTVFSSVATTVANVGSAVMGVGSSLFTAGAAGAAGGALSGTLGNIVKGALTQGAIGALVGGGISALTGGSFGKGALMGGLGGALSGGLMGAAGLGTNPFADGFGQAQGGIGADPTAATKMAVTGKTGGIKNTIPISGARAANLMEPGMPEAFRAASTGQAAKAIQPGAIMNAGAQGVTTPLASGVSKNVMGGGESGGGLLSGILGNGQVIAGIGQGLLTGMASRDASKQQMARDEADRAFKREDQERKTASYRIGPEGYNAPAQDSGAGRPEPSTKYARPRYAYDPAQGRVVAVG
jgi:hypothetical protein